MKPNSQITQLLHRLRDGSEENTPALRDELFELVYAELRNTAKGLMRHERAQHTLQPTALVNESYLRLVDSDSLSFESRAHFLGVAARCMRQILVDHARGKNAQKRGGDRQQVTLVPDLISDKGKDLELLLLHDALEKFARLDLRAAQVAEMRLFGGMTAVEIAQALGISKRSADGDWATARMWLARELSEA